MKDCNAIEVHDVVKKFKVYQDKGKTIKERALFSRRRKYEERVVLDGISFEVKRGEAVGLIGHNGCGKSTTLKLLTKIMYPDSGSIEMRGRVSSLIELGAGFHPDMSGRQNIYTNASIFGLTRKEIEARFDDIVKFSELEEYIDNPVRTYSSGMYMRLAFSVAINVDADILLIDEILAVGDANFQAKCFNKLREVKAHGTTIVIVSHSLGQIEQICERSIWLQNGEIAADGIPREIHPQYMDSMGEQRIQSAKNELDHTATEQKKDEEVEEPVDGHLQAPHTTEKNTRWGNGKARIQQIDIYDASHEKRRLFKTGESFEIHVQYNVQKAVEDAVFGIGIFRSDGINCYGTNTRIDHHPIITLHEDGILILKLGTVPLLPGVYQIDVAIEESLGIPVDYFTHACQIEIYSDISDVGIVRLEHKWQFEKGPKN